MHMADALVSPAVGGAFWAVSGGLIACCARKVSRDMRDHVVPMMGVLGAFIFAAQMINFTIPGTGSSGHLGGGLILSVLLGPYAALLVISSVLTVQALFFADGGLLALGCNIFNLGFFPAFIAYPFIYRNISAGHYTGTRGWMAALIGSVVGLTFGALSVVGQTMTSGITDLSYSTLVAMMIPIHMAIGVVEGLATAVVVAFVARSRPDALPISSQPISNLRPVLIGLLTAAVVTGGALSWFSSGLPDGLEWSITKATSSDEQTEPDSTLHQSLSQFQASTSVLPDYEFTSPDSSGEKTESWPAISAGKSVSGLVGGAITLLMAGLIGFLLRPKQTTTTAAIR